MRNKEVRAATLHPYASGRDANSSSMVEHPRRPRQCANVKEDGREPRVDDPLPSKVVIDTNPLLLLLLLSMLAEERLGSAKSGDREETEPEPNTHTETNWHSCRRCTHPTKPIRPLSMFPSCQRGKHSRVVRHGHLVRLVAVHFERHHE